MLGRTHVGQKVARRPMPVRLKVTLMTSLHARPAACSKYKVIPAGLYMVKMSHVLASLFNLLELSGLEVWIDADLLLQDVVWWFLSH